MAKRPVSFLRLYRDISGVRLVLLLLGVAASFGLGIVAPLIDYLFSAAIGYLSSDRSSSEIKDSMMFVLFGYFVVGGIFAIGDCIRVLCFRYLGRRQMALLKSQYYRSILRQEVAWHDQQSSAELIARFDTQIPKMQSIYGLHFSVMVYLIGKGVLSLVLALISDVKLTLAAYSLVPLVLLLFVVFGRISSQTSVRQAKAYAAAASVASEDLGLLRTIWLYCTQPFELRRSDFDAAVDLIIPPAQISSSLGGDSRSGEEVLSAQQPLCGAAVPTNDGHRCVYLCLWRQAHQRR